MVEPETEPKSAPSRRAVLGAAWAAPVVAFAIGTPAMAGSPAAAITLFVFILDPSHYGYTVTVTDGGEPLVDATVSVQGDPGNGVWQDQVFDTTNGAGQANNFVPIFQFDDYVQLRAATTINGQVYVSAAVPRPVPTVDLTAVPIETERVFFTVSLNNVSSDLSGLTTTLYGITGTLLTELEDGTTDSSGVSTFALDNSAIAAYSAFRASIFLPAFEQSFVSPDVPTPLV